MGGLLHLVQREGPGRGAAPLSPVLAVPNVTAHPSTASVPILYYSMWHYNSQCPLKGTRANAVGVRMGDRCGKAARNRARAVLESFFIFSLVLQLVKYITVVDMYRVCNMDQTLERCVLCVQVQVDFLCRSLCGAFSGDVCRWRQIISRWLI